MTAMMDRLIELAWDTSWRNHELCADETGHGARDGHNGPHQECPHRDCELVRRAVALPPARSVAQEAEPMCVCGHPMDMHGNDGAGHCGASRSCRAGGCKKFRLKGEPEPAIPQEDLPEAAAKVLRDNIWTLIGSELVPPCSSGVSVAQDADSTPFAAIRGLLADRPGDQEAEDAISENVILHNTCGAYEREHLRLLALVTRWEAKGADLALSNFARDQGRSQQAFLDAADLLAELEKRT